MARFQILCSRSTKRLIVESMSLTVAKFQFSKVRSKERFTIKVRALAGCKVHKQLRNLFKLPIHYTRTTMSVFHFSNKIFLVLSMSKTPGILLFTIQLLPQYPQQGRFTKI